MDIDHLSISQINMYSRCGQAYYYRYCEGIKAPPGIALITGKSVHAAREKDLVQKIVSGEDLPLEEIKEEASIQVKESFEEEEIDLQGETDKKKVMGIVEDQSVALTELDYNHNLVNTMPIRVEHKVELDVESIGCSLHGIIDLVDSDFLIRDLKTSGKSLSQKDADSSLQLTMYSLMHRLSEKKEESGVQLDVLVKTKTPKALNIVSKRDNQDIQVLLNRIARTKDGIEKEAWTPCAPDHWACSEKFCGYFRRCPYSVKKVTI